MGSLSNYVFKFYNHFNLSIIGMLLMILIMLKQIHIIQLNSYNLDQQIIWYKRNVKSYLLNIVLLAVVILIPLLSFLLYYFFGNAMQSGQNSTAPFWTVSILLYLMLLLAPILLLAMLIENLPRKQKKKLVFTKRILRLILITLLMYAIWFIIAFKLKSLSSIWFVLFGVAICHLLVFVAYLITLPIENSIRKKFMNEAKAIIDANSDLCVIGITGSFGKTSVKFYLDSILKAKYSVCKTPESFNTAMGATLTIKNDLRNIDDIFICEMGARRIGDIKEICDIVSPSGAIITDVGNMHLDTFRSIENVLNTKFELVEAATHNRRSGKFGEIPILVNGDNELIRKKVIEAFGITEQSNIKYYGFGKENTFYADNIVASEKGTRFRFNSKEFGSEEFETRLLGKYNIMNLVAAISYSLILGIDVLTIKNAVKNIEPVPHRLQILPYGTNDFIIDDAYNSNPMGARNAVDVLSSFEGYIKVIITPGMVELNDKQDEENEKFAEYAGDKVDYAIVVGGTNKIALNKGFEKTLSKDKLFNIERVEDAIKYAMTNISGKKVILLENDLSDNY